MNTIQYPPGTAGQRLGITCIISKTIAGLPWTFAYDSDGGLVTMMPSDEYENRVLEKRAKPELVAALEFQDLFRTDAEDDDLDATDYGASDDPDFVGAFFEKAADDARRKNSSIDADLADASWNEIIGVEKSDKQGTPVTYAQSTLGGKLGVVRSERKEIDGEVYNIGYDAHGVEVGSLRVRE